MLGKSSSVVRMTKKEFNELLSKGEVKSKIISDFAMLDDLLGVIMARYFVGEDRERTFVELVVDHLPFSRKLIILKRAKYYRKYKSLEVLNFLDSFSKLRNIAAHHYSWSIKDDDFERLQNNKNVMRLMTDFPHTLDNELTRAIDRLARLQNTKDFLKRRPEKKST